MNLPYIINDSKSYYLQESKLKEMLSRVCVEPFTESLPPGDEKAVYLQSAVQRLFPDIKIQQHSLLICQHIYSKTYSIFFVNSKLVPYGYCCNNPVMLKCYPIGFGLMLCTNPRCLKPELKAFKFTDSDPKSEETINRKLSRLITTGKHKQLNLIREKQKIGVEILQKDRNYTEPVEPCRKTKSTSLHGRQAAHILRRPYRLV